MEKTDTILFVELFPEKMTDTLIFGDIGGGACTNILVELLHLFSNKKNSTTIGRRKRKIKNLVPAAQNRKRSEKSFPKKKSALRAGFGFWNIRNRVHYTVPDQIK